MDDSEKKENLFDNPTTLRNPADFVGRRDLLKRIFGLLQAKQSISLVGPRRIGKTSLLNGLRSPEIQQQCNFDGSHFLFLYLDLQKRAMKMRVDFFDEICRVLREQGQRLGYVLVEGLDRDDEFEMLLDEFERHDLYPVLMMDAFDEIAHYQSIGEEVFSFLRSVGSEGRISYITASMKALGEIIRKLVPMYQEGSSPFYNILASVRLTAFSLEEAREYLVGTSRKGGLPFTVKEINWILQLAGTHPFLLQQVAVLLFEAKKTYSAESIKYSYIQEEAQQNLFSHFDDFWGLLGPVERKAIIADTRPGLAERKVAAADAKREAMVAGAAPFDKRSGTQESREIRMYSDICRNQLFRTYLRDAGFLETVPLEFKEALVEFKELLEKFDNPVALGESVLSAKLPFLEERIKQQKANTTSVRGRVIQETLREALKGMEGQGNRTDVSDDWVYYNILYYRYFRQKHDMNQDAVARRLAISERQYYRLLPKAIERLWKELLMMDTAVALEPGD